MAEEKHDWPLFSRGDLTILNPKSPVGVCVLWSEKHVMLAKHLASVQKEIAIAGNLYSIFGVGILIRNFLAHPTLRYLIVTGAELGGGKATLQRLGNDSTVAKKLFLEDRHVERFLDQVKIIFTSNQDIARLINEAGFRDSSFERRPFEPIVVPIPEPKTVIFPSSRSGHVIHARTIGEGYRLLLHEIRRFGHMTAPDSEGHRRQELWELHMIITDQDPVDFGSVPHPEFDAERMERYCVDFWEGTEPKEEAYRYGHIIRHEFGGDQITRIVEAFREKPETFRTVISLWNPHIEEGSIRMKDPPCLIILHPRLIGDRFELWAYIRTNDMLAGWPANAMALRYFQYRLLGILRGALGRSDLALGDLDITSGSAHLYERSFLIADQMIQKRGTPLGLHIDQKGSFAIGVEGGEIVVRHFNLSTELLQVFRGRTAEELERKLSPFISQVSHALYVGRELMKAEQQLRR